MSRLAKSYMRELPKVRLPYSRALRCGNEAAVSR